VIARFADIGGIVYYHCLNFLFINKGNNKITEHRAIFQRERQNS